MHTCLRDIQASASSAFYSRHAGGEKVEICFRGCERLFDIVWRLYLLSWMAYRNLLPRLSDAIQSLAASGLWCIPHGDAEFKGLGLCSIRWKVIALNYENPGISPFCDSAIAAAMEFS